MHTEKTRLRQAESLERELLEESGELMEQYISGVNCAPTTAREEMIVVKKRFGKEGGIVAFHGYQSIAPGECNPARAYEIGIIFVVLHMKIQGVKAIIRNTIKIY